MASSASANSSETVRLLLRALSAAEIEIAPRQFSDGKHLLNESERSGQDPTLLRLGKRLGIDLVENPERGDLQL
jgi:hypothetical protein